MPIAYHAATARFDGVCTVEEAMDFAEWLREPGREVDLGACSHMHAALLQCLMAWRPVLATPPADDFLAGCLAILPRATAAPARKRTRKGSPA